MAVNISLTNVTSLQNENTALAQLAANNAAITTAFQDVLARDGTSPNPMEADLDLNSNSILNVGGLDMTGHRISNVGAPVFPTDLVRLEDLTSIGGGASSATEYPSPLYYSGLEFADYTSIGAWKTQLNVGSCSIGNATPAAGQNILMAVTAPIIIDLSTNGANGMALTETAPPTYPTTLQPYLFIRTDTGLPAVLFSSSTSYSGLIGKLPSGFSLTYCRKLRFGLCVKPDGTGLYSFRYFGGNPASVALLNPDVSGTFNVMTDQTYSDWTNVQLANWVPDSARTARVNCRVKATGNTGGFAWWRPIGNNASTGIPLGWVPGVNGWEDSEEIFLDVGSTANGQAIQIKCQDPSVVVSMRVIGYNMDELS